MGTFDGGYAPVLTNDFSRDLKFDNPLSQIDALEAAKKALEDLLKLVWEKLSEAITGAVGGLGDIAAWAFDMAGNVGQMLNQLAQLFQDLLHDPGKVLGAIPQALVAGLASTLDNINGFVQDLVNAILRAIRGIPVVGGTLADIIAEVGGLQEKASDAQSTATSVQGTVQVQAVTVGVVDGLTVVRTPITSTQTWNRSAIPAGCTERVKTGVGLVGSGQGGARPSRSPQTAAYGTDGNTGTFYVSPRASGGSPGGYIYAEFAPESVGASQTVTIGAGGAGATSNGSSGSYGGTTSFGSLLSIASGTGGGIITSIGVVHAGGAGRGGDGGSSDGSVNGIGAPQPIWEPGQQGEQAYRVQGGAAGTGNGGNGGAGQNGPTDDSVLSGGSGGGGGASGGSGGGVGGAGGIPGGGGGGGGGGGNSNPNNGGNGGRGEALISEYFR